MCCGWVLSASTLDGWSGLTAWVRSRRGGCGGAEDPAGFLNHTHGKV